MGSNGSGFGIGVGLASEPGAEIGPLLFARYAFPPNELGYCGPEDPEGKSLIASSKSTPEEIRPLARQFSAAWPYLELIAEANGIDDPLDERVVSAYWVGSELLDRVPPEAFSQSSIVRFEQRFGRTVEELTYPLFHGASLHHNFHVFSIYPWLGVLRKKHAEGPLQILEQCRIRWGRVISISSDAVSVTSQPLVFDGWRLSLGRERTEEVNLPPGSVEGRLGPGDQLEIGDWVTLHWGWLCERLTESSVLKLQSATSSILTAVNSVPR